MLGTLAMLRWSQTLSLSVYRGAAAATNPSIVLQVAMQKSIAGRGLTGSAPSRAMQPFRAVRLDVSAAATEERLRLHNLSPQKGSRRDNKRKGRGYGQGQVRGVVGGW